MSENSTSHALLSIVDARVRLSRRKILQVSSFTLHPGQHWCLYGGNGAGKTVFARLLRNELIQGRRFVQFNKDFEPERDIVTVSFEEQQRLWALDNRHDISEFDATARDAGTTLEILATSATDAPPAEDQLAALLNRLGIAAQRQSGIRYLSSGQIRKGLIVRALLSKLPGHARLLILDEPLEAIDRNARPIARRLLDEWLDGDNAIVSLCRRLDDIPDGATHLAEIVDLQLLRQGPIQKFESPEKAIKKRIEEVLSNLHLPCERESRESTAPQDREMPVCLREVTARYRDKVVLHQVNWRMEYGTHTLIEGPNGCGKSTLLSLIDGENHMAYGQEVYLFGRKRGSGESVWDIKARFGVVSNEIHNKYLKGWKVIDVVVSGFFDTVGLYDDSGGTQVDTAEQWLKALGVVELEREYYQEVSFGQQRLVLLARAMVKNPEVLILDEPCVGLDDYHRELILRVVDKIAAETSTQIIFVSHTEGEAPSCINQTLHFLPLADGTHQVKVSVG